MRSVSDRLEQLAEAGLRRHLGLSHGRDLGSNDALGLRHHPSLRRAMIQALEEGAPVGSGGSRLLSGNSQAWTAVEAAAASWQGRQAALYFGSGYQANVGTLSALIEAADLVLSDSLNHASIIDGLRLSRGRVEVIPHGDLAAYERALAGAPGGAWVVVESLYSMDGDLTPLRALDALCRRYHGRLIVDEAHATGLYGDAGGGRCQELGLSPFLTIHPCGKSMGLSGAFVCADRDTIDLLINRARSLIYSTAPSPVLAPALGAAIDLLRGMGADRSLPLRRGEQLRQRLAGRIDTGASASHIVPIIIGGVEAASAAAEGMRARGWGLGVLRPPTVPAGGCRLRVVCAASLSEADVDQLAKDLLDVCC